MLQVLNLTKEDILHQLKISCQIPSVLEGIATRKIMADTAHSLGIQIETEEIQQAADNLRLANNLLKVEDTLLWLKKYYLSLDDFEEIAYTNLLANKLATHLFLDKAEQFFYEHQLDYVSAIIYEVVLDDEDLAIELFYALQENEITFPEIARQYIKDSELSRTGGYQGMRRRTDFRPEIAAAIFAATPPQILKPIVTSKGVHLILVDEIIQPQLDNSLHTRIMGDLFAGWLRQQIENLQIVAQLDDDISQSEASKIEGMRFS